MKARVVLISLVALTAMLVLASTLAAAPVKENVLVPPAVVQQTASAPQTVAVTQTVVAQATPAVAQPVKRDLESITAAYKTSAHSNDYGLERGPNTYCARCHSPRNWDPKAIAGPAPNCMACKFPFDKEVRKPPPNTNVFIEEKDWKNVGCDVCHQVANNVVDGKPAIWNQASGKYEAVATATELCEKCHTDSIGGSMHKMVMSGNAHTNQIGITVKRPQLCTDCHDPHSTQASCTNCHSKLSQTPGHTAIHAKVTCTACHDASGMKLAPNAKGQWVGSRMTVSAASGRASESELVSHSLQKAVDCTRCHYNNNPQKLRSFVTPTATPTVGTPAAARPTAAGTPAAAGPTATVAK